MQSASPQDLRGIDVSRWQGEIDWQAVRGDNIDFAYLKATEGTTWVDPKFFENARGGRHAGMPVGAYHFARPDLNQTLKNAVTEAQHFIKIQLQGFGNFGDIYPVLDLEKPFPKNKKTVSVSYLLSWVDIFKSYFEGETGRTLMLYTGIFFIREYDHFKKPLSGYPLAEMPLWIALFPKSASPYTTSPPDAGNWNRWTVWQYTDNGRVKGIDGKVDLNRALPELLS